MLWRNFPEAEIRAGAQHFATLDDCYAGQNGPWTQSPL
ncbi:hypothetical protein TR2A62_1545 [Thalassobium sp. R2A62]|nr:hypothetical protein TR2A62_1545 [Thalassobium sp. R2A62]